MLEVAAALDIVLAHSPHLPAEAIAPLVGRVVAEDIGSDIDSPPFDKAMMDGYALRAADSGAGVLLQVIDEVAAGRVPTKTIGAAQAVRIMTGAQIPAGADTVVPHEETESAGEQVRLTGKVIAGQHILTRGREMRAGEVVITAGTALNAAAIGLLSAVGRTTVLTHKTPRVAVISTGDELVEANQRPGPGAIRNSNGPMLRALAERCGLPAKYLGIGRDDPASMARLFRQAFESSDIVITSGGVSAGKLDFVPGVLKELGVETHFHKINMKPGKPLLFGTLGEKLVFGLPGNPVSSFVGFELFIRPASRKMAGHRNPWPMFVPMPLAAELKMNSDRPTYLPGRLEISPQGWCVRPSKWFGSADLRSLMTTDALIRVPAGPINYAADELVPTAQLKM